MRPVYQTHFAVPLGDGVCPQGPLGNCFQAALASVLEKPLASVPHFVETHGPDHPEAGPAWWVATRAWLAREFDLGLVYFPADEFPTPRHALIEDPPEDWVCMAGGRSPRGNFNHIVVVDAAGKMVHDPRPPAMGGPFGLVGPPHGWDILVPADVMGAVA